MARRRSYADRCGVARALDVVGERWALLVVRELLLGPKRFTDLRTGLPRIGPDVLAQRLRELEQAGVVGQGRLPPPAATQVYELTSRGHELEPVVLALGLWGSAVAFPDEPAAFGSDSAVLALKTLFVPPAAGDSLLGQTFELRLGDQDYWLRPGAGSLAAARGAGANPAASIASDPATLAQKLWHGGTLRDELRSGGIEIKGDRRSAQRLLRCFPPPD
jgi:DNA-binding HxlR family transcriptional regulator